MISSRLVSLVARLQRPDLRQAAAVELAALAGATSAFVFGADTEAGVYLPAPGLRQTLRQGARWQTFLTQCAQDGSHHDGLPDPASSADVPAFGLADAEALCIAVFLGAAPDARLAAELRELLPLLGAKLIDERAALAATGHAAAARDATKRAHALNEALEQNRFELREAIERAERELSFRRLAESRLLEADRRKDDFLATLAHELRNPLGAISSAVALTERHEGRPSGFAQKARDTIRRQLEHLTYLVNDLLDVARISQGKLTLKREPVEVGDFIAAAIEITMRSIENRGHKLTVIQPNHPITISGDTVRLAQAVGNLLHNAAKYTLEHGEISLSVTRHQRTLKISVSDNGIGIRPEAIDDIFTMFVHGDHLPGRTQEGLGVGLALVKEVVALHGGSVDVASEGPGRGSIFSISLPIDDESAARMPVAAPALPIPRGPKRILLVDDNQDALEMLKICLEFDGHHICTAHNGRMALDAAHGFQPEVVCLDIGLPDISGYQVAREMRAMPALHATILIAITGMGQDKDRESGIDAGFDHYLVKPINLSDLSELIAAGPRIANATNR